MVKKLIVTFAICSGLAFAGPGYVLTYPVLHRHQMIHAGHNAAKAVGSFVKALVW